MNSPIVHCELILIPLSISEGLGFHITGKQVINVVPFFGKLRNGGDSLQTMLNLVSKLCQILFIIYR